VPKKITRNRRYRIARAGSRRGRVVVSHPADRGFKPDNLRPFRIKTDS